MKSSLYQILPHEFFDHPPSVVAPKLLGKFIIRQINNQELIGRIVETEAYLPSNDYAAHGSRGKTKSNATLFGPPGIAYVYHIHRYHCLDIVTQDELHAGSVLIRALEPIEGIELMQKFRQTDQTKNLTNGPGKLCQALQINKKEDGLDVTDPNSSLIVADLKSKPILKEAIVISKRIGISKSQDLPLRFSFKDNPYVSR